MKDLMQRLIDAQTELHRAPEVMRGYWEVVIDSIVWNLGQTEAAR
jgi:hypothetical protein